MISCRNDDQTNSCEKAPPLFQIGQKQGGGLITFAQNPKIFRLRRAFLGMLFIYQNIDFCRFQSLYFNRNFLKHEFNTNCKPV